MTTPLIESIAEKYSNRLHIASNGWHDSQQWYEEVASEYFPDAIAGQSVYEYVEDAVRLALTEFAAGGEVVTHVICFNGEGAGVILCRGWDDCLGKFFAGIGCDDAEQKRWLDDFADDDKWAMNEDNDRHCFSSPIGEISSVDIYIVYAAPRAEPTNAAQQDGETLRVSQSDVPAVAAPAYDESAPPIWEQIEKISKDFPVAAPDSQDACACPPDHCSGFKNCRSLMATLHAAAKSDTPQTDIDLGGWTDLTVSQSRLIPAADFAKIRDRSRTLERRIAALTAERDALRKFYDEFDEEWPGGLDEIESCWTRHARRADKAESDLHREQLIHKQSVEALNMATGEILQRAEKAEQRASALEAELFKLDAR